MPHHEYGSFQISHLQIPGFLNTTPNVCYHLKYHTYAKTNPPLSLKHQLDNTL